LINSKEDLRYYIERDNENFWSGLSWKMKLIYWLTRDPLYEIRRFKIYLRMEEYYTNVTHGRLGFFMSMFYRRKRNNLGNKLGFDIHINCFGPGLIIYHHGEIIVNYYARIGENCRLHGGNCIGNDGKNEEAPLIGDNVDIGIGAKVIGNVCIANNTRIGANAVVTKSFQDEGITLVGIPAHRH
jgi:serine O-acetyltransferase